MKKMWTFLLGLSMVCFMGSTAFADWTFERHYVTDDFNNVTTFDVADIDSDGDLDVLAGSNSGDEIMWFENNGSNSFTAHAVITGPDVYDLDVIDIDGDGDQDFFVASSSDDILAWLENDGNENFSVNNVDTSLNGVRASKGVDLDKDGDVDVVAAAYDGDELVWYESDGNTTFAKRIIRTSLNGVQYLKVIDLDKDGDLDIVSSAGLAGDLDWWENDGSQVFTERSIAGSHTNVDELDVADMDNDGDLDIVTGSATGSIGPGWWENNGSQSFSYTAFDLQLTEPEGIAVGDIDNDGDMDVVNTDADDSRIYLFENQGAGVFVKRPLSSNEFNFDPVQLVDLNNDGILEIFSSCSGDDDIVWFELHDLDSLTLASSGHGIISTSVYLSGSTLYLGTQNDGRVQIFNVANPAAPNQLGEYTPTSVDTYNPAQALDMVGSYLYSVNRKSQMLEAIDVSNPAAPVQACSNTTTTSNAGGLAIRGENAFVGSNNGLLYVMRQITSDYMGVSPTADIGSGIKSMALYNTNTLVVTESSEYLTILDVTDPYNPGMLASVTLTAEPQDVEVAGNYAYVACMEEGLWIIDISTPTAPVVVSRYMPEGFANAVTVVGNYAYLGTGTYWATDIVCGLYMININNPANPYLERHYTWDPKTAGENMNVGIREVAVSGNYIMAASSQGLLVLSTDVLPTATPTPDYSLITSTPTPKVDSVMEKLKEVLAYPNPAQDVVNFILEDDRCDTVRIDIFNMNGERIASLEQSSPGRTMTWQADKVSPGIYLYQTVITRNGVEEKLKIKKLAISK